MATAELHVDSNQYTLPVVKASAGPDGIVVSKLRNDGWVTLDPGFLTTAQCESKITFIDGNRSILRYRGYPIEQLCEHSDFLEVAWLLRHGDLPTQAEYDRFCSDINHKTMVGEDFRTFMGSFPRAAHPMSVLAAAVNALAAFYPDTTDITDSDQLDEAAKIIMAKARTVVSYIFRRRRDEPMLYPDLARGYVDDFLRMCFAVPYERFDSDRCTCTRSAVCSSSMPTMSRIAPRRWSASPAPPTRTCMRRSPPASTRCPGRCMAARTRPCCVS